MRFTSSAFKLALRTERAWCSGVPPSLADRYLLNVNRGAMYDGVCKLEFLIRFRRALSSSGGGTWFGCGSGGRGESVKNRAENGEMITVVLIITPFRTLFWDLHGELVWPFEMKGF